MGWSTRHPGTLVIIDHVGHKLIFENVSLQSPQGRGEARLAQSGSPSDMSLRGSEATAAISPSEEQQTSGAGKQNPPTPNEAKEIQTKPPNKARTRAAASPNKASENRPVTPNKAGENPLRSTNKPQTSGEKPPNKPVAGRYRLESQA